MCQRPGSLCLRLPGPARSLPSPRSEGGQETAQKLPAAMPTRRDIGCNIPQRVVPCFAAALTTQK